MKPVLLTGASGFIGRHVQQAFARQTIPLRTLDVAPAASGGQAPDIRGSVSDAGAVREAAAGCDAIVHLAYRIDIDGADPQASFETNVRGTLNVLESALALGIRRVVWASSIMTYGAPCLHPAGPVGEHGVQAPATFYGATKLFLEKAALAYRAKGLETVALRMSTVFGPGRDRGGAAPFAVELFTRPAAGLPVALDEGDRRLDFIYGPDAAMACLAAARAPGPLLPAYNVGGFSARIRDVADAVRHVLPQARIEVRPGGANPWPEALAIDAARRDLGWEPRHDLASSASDYLSSLVPAGPSPSSQTILEPTHHD